MLSVWTDKDFNYLETKDAENCAKCNNSFQIGYIILNYISCSNKAYYNLYCINCINKVIIIGDQEQRLPIIIVDNKPKKSDPYIFKPLGLINGKMISTFNVGEIEKLGGTTKDNTKYANRSNRLKVLIDQENELKLIDQEKDKHLTTDDELYNFFNKLGVPQ